MKKNYSLYAAIDLGSNAARMQIVQIDKSGTYEVLEDLFKGIEMGEEVFEAGYVRKESMKEVCEVLNGFKKIMREYGVKDYRAVATSALRELEERDYILDYIKVNTGFKVEVISYCEETFLKHKVLTKRYKESLKDGKNNLLLDIGAGGIEISLYKEDRIEASYHIKVGTLRVVKFLEELESKTMNFYKIMESYIYSKMYSVKPYLYIKKIDRVIVIGGEIKLISSTIGGEITQDSLDKLYHNIIKQLPQDGNIKQLIPTIILIREICKMVDCNDIKFPKVSLKDGIIEDEIDNKIDNVKLYEDLESVMRLAKELGQRYFYDKKHADYVEKISVKIFEATKKIHGLGEREKFLLRLAAQLHDVGKYINMDNYSIHSYNIINSSNIMGISDTEKSIIANIAKHHHFSDINSSEALNYKMLTPKNRVVTAKLTAILQFADCVDVRRNQYIDDVEISVRQNDIIIKMNEDKDVLFEDWLLNTKVALFSNVFGLNIMFRKGGSNI